jgi:sulfonate transport system permease protein
MTRRRRSGDRPASGALLAIAIAVGVLALWELVARTFLARSRALPPPSEIGIQLWRDRRIYEANVGPTVRNAGMGFLEGNLAALAVGILFVQIPVVEKALLRLALAIYAMPILAIAPILLVILNGDGPKIALAALAVFFPTLIAVMIGLRSADRASLEVVASLGGSSWDAMRKVRLRSALPIIFAGLAIAAPAALLGAILGEFLIGDRGLGAVMVQAMASLETTRLWAVALVTAAIASTAYAAMNAMSRFSVRTGHGGSADISVGAVLPKTVRTGERSPFWRRPIGRAVAFTGSLVVVLLAWAGFIKTLRLDPYFAKDPLDVWRFLITSPEAGAHWDVLLGALRSTVSHAAVGFVSGTAGAVLVASLFVLLPSAERALMPIAIALRSIPLVAMTPLIVLVFGRGLLAVTIMVGILTFFGSLAVIAFGLRSVAPSTVDVLRTYNASSMKILVTARAPAALPAFFAALRLTAPAAILGAVIAEWLATGNGIGFLMISSGNTSEYDMLWSALVLVTVVSVALYSFAQAIETRILRVFAG